MTAYLIFGELLLAFGLMTLFGYCFKNEKILFGKAGFIGALGDKKGQLYHVVCCVISPMGIGLFLLWSYAFGK
jgi:hypothetical protein